MISAMWWSCLLQLRNANCQTVYKRTDVGYDGVTGWAVPSEYGSSAENVWRHAGSAAAMTGTDKTAPGGPSHGMKYSGGDSGGPVVVRGGSVVMRPAKLPPAPSHHEGFDAEVDVDGLGPAVYGSEPFGPPSQSPFLGYLRLVGGPAGLLRLLFGPQVLSPPLPVTLDRYLSFCNRMAAVGRFLGRLFEPLFTTGFYMAASYVFRRTILPRLAHYIHLYATAVKDREIARRLGGADDSHSSARNSGTVQITAAVQEAIPDGPCLRRMVCEAGLGVASYPIAHSVQR